MNEIPQFRFSMPVNARWNDMDSLGHVNNVYYFEYFQIARGQYMNAVSENWDWMKHMFVIAHIECDFYRELTLKSKNPMIKTRTTALSNKSFKMDYLITSEAEDGSEVVHAKGNSVNVMVDIKKKTSVMIPDWLRKDITEYEPELTAAE